MKYLKILLVLLALLLMGYFLGPRTKFEKVDGNIPDLNISINQVEDFLKEKAALVKDLKPGNGHVLKYFDGVKKTPYALIYLHGFSASPVEGAPLNQQFADRYGMNYYAPLLTDHGRDTDESFLSTEPQEWVADAAEAIAIGKLLGDQVIVMSCSTGGTLSAYLAAENPNAIAGQIFYAPNFDLEDQSSKLLLGPWGKPLAKLILGGNHRSYTLPEAAMPFWTTKYRLEGLLALRSLLNQTMTSEIWQRNNTPLLIAYYYKDETHKDMVISTAAIEAFAKQVGTAQDQLMVRPLAEPKSHVIASPLQSKNVKVVEQVTFEFAEKILKLIPVVELEPDLSEHF